MYNSEEALLNSKLTRASLICLSFCACANVEIWRSVDRRATWIRSFGTIIRLWFDNWLIVVDRNSSMQIMQKHIHLWTFEKIWYFFRMGWKRKNYSCNYRDEAIKNSQLKTIIKILSLFFEKLVIIEICSWFPRPIVFTYVYIQGFLYELICIKIYGTLYKLRELGNEQKWLEKRDYDVRSVWYTVLDWSIFGDSIFV